MEVGPRRIVTGLDANGRSTIIFDDRRPLDESRPIDFPHAQVVWRVKTSPADNSGNEDAGDVPFDLSFLHDREGSSFTIFNFKPEDGLIGPGMHTTDTIDYIVVLKGRVELHCEDGMVELNVGDVLVDRGISHGWRAAGGEPAMAAVMVVPAHPVGRGASF